MRTIALTIACLVGCCEGRAALAQPFLDKLEQRVREQLQAPKGPAEPAATAPDASPAKKPPEPGEPVRPDAPAQAPERGYLGIVTDDRDDRGRGVRVLQVRPGSPGEKSGLRAQDLITGVGGIRVRQMSDLAAIFDQVPPGGTLAFDILRGQERLNLQVTFGQRAAPPKDTPIEQSAPPKLTQDTPTERQRLEALERRVQQLEERLQQLERALLEKR